MTGKELLRVLEADGWTLDRIRGSHHILVKTGHRAIPVPIHGNRELPIGIESAILRQAGLKRVQ
jgi:predicted RNA binding protein YcfA (HicA-like mRNA interferase family)